MDILSGLTKDDDEWNGGTILDPKNGKEYKCYIKLLDNNTKTPWFGFSYRQNSPVEKSRPLEHSSTKQLILCNIDKKLKSPSSQFSNFWSILTNNVSSALDLLQDKQLPPPFNCAIVCTEYTGAPANTITGKMSFL